jgi:hypothetical protein
MEKQEGQTLDARPKAGVAWQLSFLTTSVNIVSLSSSTILDPSDHGLIPDFHKLSEQP